MKLFLMRHAEAKPLNHQDDRLRELTEKGIKEAVLFSSGNALISLLEYLQLYPEFKLNNVSFCSSNNLKSIPSTNFSVQKPSIFCRL